MGSQGGPAVSAQFGPKPYIDGWLFRNERSAVESRWSRKSEKRT